MRCHGCKEFKSNCCDFAEDKEAEVKCGVCHRLFFGPSCFEKHKQNGVCDEEQICPIRFKVVRKRELRICKRTKRVIPHQCHVAQCYGCGLDIDLLRHKCFIPKVDPKDDECGPAELQIFRRRNLRYAAEQTPDEERHSKKPPTLKIFADYETYLEEGTKQHNPILVRCQRDDEDGIESFYGGDCSERFLEYLDEQTFNEEHEECHVIVFP